jgi:hypothetical protein
VSDVELVHIDDEDFPLRLDHTRPYVISSWGKKGSGKSYFNGLIYQSWPGDKLAIDVNGHAYVGPDAKRINPDEGMPKSWPEQTGCRARSASRRTCTTWPTRRAATYRDDLDRAVGMALFPQDHPVLLWAGEVGELTPQQERQPHMRRPSCRTATTSHRPVRRPAADERRPAGAGPVRPGGGLPAAQPDRPQADRRHDRVRARSGSTTSAGAVAAGKHWFLLWQVETETLWHVPAAAQADTSRGNGGRVSTVRCPAPWLRLASARAAGAAGLPALRPGAPCPPATLRVPAAASPAARCDAASRARRPGWPARSAAPERRPRRPHGPSVQR